MNKAQKVASKDNNEEHVPLVKRYMFLIIVKREIVKKKKKDTTHKSEKESDKEPVIRKDEPRQEENKEKKDKEPSINLSIGKGIRGKVERKPSSQLYKKKAVFWLKTNPTNQRRKGWKQKQMLQKNLRRERK